MPRPHCCRRIGGLPVCTCFRPQGVPAAELEEVVLRLDEFEALRLSDLEGLYQEEAAERMGISRPTFSRIIESARRKVAEALVKGKALRVEGGNVVIGALRIFRCADCQHTWELPYGTGRPAACPKCQSRNIHRAEEDRGWARGRPGGWGRRRGCCYRGGRGGPSDVTSDAPK